MKNYRVNLTWSDNYENKESREYKKLAGRIEKRMLKFYTEKSSKLQFVKHYDIWN